MFIYYSMTKKINCGFCEKLFAKSNISHHIKICPKNPNKDNSRYKLKSCDNCGKNITSPHFARHKKTCKNQQTPLPTTSHSNLKRSVSNVSDIDEQPEIKIPRLEDNSSVVKQVCDNITSAGTSTINAVTNAGSSLVNKFKNLFKKDYPEVTEEEFFVKETAFKSRLITYQCKNIHGIKDLALFIDRFITIIISMIKYALEEYNLKVNFVLTAKYRRTMGDSYEIDTFYMRTSNVVILKTTDLTKVLEDAKNKLLSQAIEFERRGSGWSLYEINHLEVGINRYIPFRGSSYIELPISIKAKRAVINIKNNDQKCFLWSIISALHPVDRKDNPNRLSNYKPYEHDFDEALRDITFPVSLDDVKKFERRTGISINVYCYKEKCKTDKSDNKKKTTRYCEIYPLLVTDSEKDQHVDLLYMKTEKTTHYCLIKDLCRLVHSQLTKDCRKIYICKRCLQHFGREDLLNKHKEDCNTHEAVKIKLPKKGEVIKFTNYKAHMKIPFVMYADFECMLSPIQTCQPSTSTSYTVQYQHHEARTFALYTTYIHGDYKEPITYFGKDAGKVFSEKLKSELEDILQFYMDNKKPMLPLTEEEKRQAREAVACHICGHDLDDKSVRDHDHLTGKFRGMAHNSCNLNYQIPKFIPLFVHNLSGYDTHLFVKMLRLDEATKIDVIPNNEERYISYTVDFGVGIKVRFLDSLKFTLDSLDNLAKNLNKDQLKHTSKFTDHLDLLVKKGVYCYDYMDNDEKYLETKLPSKEDFYNKLNKCHISDADYEHALNIWKTFNITDMKEYTLFYNKTDVLLLADVMENFRNICIDTYSLDPAWFFTTPGLAWSAMLKYTNIELELLTDYEMILMITKGIRGGISQCSNRYAIANNPYMGDEYDPNLPTSYLLYLDAVNLYGWAQCQPMPFKDFKWCDTNIDVRDIDNESDIGYILEVDLEYPQELHDAHSELPLAPEKRVPPGSKETKLLTTLYNKEKYVIHYWSLKLYLSLGMKLTKIHRVLQFKQSKWLKPYIDRNIEMWRKMNNKSDKQFFKLMSNSIYGKAVENIRNRVDIRLATQEKQVDKWIAKPYFKHRTIFSENLSAIHMRKQSLLFNKAIYVGMSILDISKTLIYDFHYNFFKIKYGDRARLQYEDTDSLQYLVETDNVYKDMKETLDRYDTSNFKKNNLWEMPQVNKKKLGTMKDELGGRILYEYVGLKSKMYSNRSEKKKNSNDFEYMKKSKGVKKSVVKNEINFEDYKTCLFEQKEMYKSMNQIRSKHHELYTVELYKKVLSHSDDKRYLLEDGVTSLPWGHYKIPKEVEVELELVNLCIE